MKVCRNARHSCISDANMVSSTVGAEPACAAGSPGTTDCHEDAFDADATLRKSSSFAFPPGRTGWSSFWKTRSSGEKAKTFPFFAVACSTTPGGASSPRKKFF
eukprot:g709.t1